ncbi:hypothetical protein HELRODRAFT_163507 [Helobdella robusta]|uniref:Reelin domain-containing protein n=1 Tax=Helobdella robusta TaxID=6412 RepID=T1EU53_HELRO|nr:hypothetical protein HELRODRAFT_163507 [Helobdella robusta]ESN96446.1 hypothetical protein HELRODRAFT_163507 [Helobdella robusta]
MRKNLKLLISVLQLAVLNAFRNGAPESTCATLAPEHGEKSFQTSHPGHTITVEKDASNYKVTIDSLDAENKIGGFILKAMDLQNKSIGKCTVVVRFAHFWLVVSDVIAVSSARSITSKFNDKSAIVIKAS